MEMCDKDGALGQFSVQAPFLRGCALACFPRVGVGGWWRPVGGTSTGFQQSDPGSADLKAGQGTP